MTTRPAMSNVPNEAPHPMRGVRGIPRRTASGPAPLSFGQQRLWFLNQLRPNDSAYNMIQVLRLRGPLDVPALEQALNEIRRRHDVLRANFDLVGDQLVQFVAAYRPVPVTVIDCSNCPEDQLESACQEAIDSYSRPPFNLKNDRLMRTALVRLGPAEHRLVLVLHHIIYDGWSTRLLLQECATLYEAFAQGKPSPLPELPIQYSDYARWEREWLTGRVLDKQLSYWKERLRGSVSPLELPADRPRRGAGEASTAARVAKVMPVELVQSLKSLGQRHSCTLFMTLLAAFQTLLSRVSGQDDIVVGSPIAGRTQLETEKLLGFFVNTLPIRIDMSGRPTFAELLDRVRSVVLDAIKHQELPFEKLVEELQPERSLNHSPLVQVMLNAFLLDVPQLHAQGLTFESLMLPAEVSKFDLTMYVRKAGQNIQVDLKYNADLFDAVRMEHMLEQFFLLLQQIVAAPDKRIASYSLLTKASRHIVPDPTVALSEPRFEPVTDVFLSHVRQSPGQTAVKQAGHSWTYSELWSSAEAIAHALLARRLQRGEAVGLMGPRSFGFIAALVGIFRSGGVLLTVDRSLPVTRQRLILTEARATHLVYVGERGGGEEWLRGMPGLEIISVAKDGSLEKPSVSISVPDVTPEDAAYVFFTSGTTGIPKGVRGCHKSLSQFIAWQQSTFDVRPDDRCAQLTSPSFEVILRDVFLPLMSGATLCLPDETADTASGDMLSWMDREGITIFHAVPTLGQTWLGTMANGARPRKLRWAFFGGEPLTDRLVARWRTVLPPTAGIVNLYGPGETTLAKCFHVIPEQPTHGVQPLGKPLPYAQALVLNDERELCGVGEPGEIVIRTPFRTYGYINAPAEQQKRFVSNPFGHSPEDLVYLTGDRGRYRPDGVLEFLGRIDDQVKIRGVRIEPAEVTAVLGRHPKVAACFVTAVNDTNGENILAAFVVPAVPSSALATELRSYVSEQLPRAMVPSAFVFLDALPMSSNGKVDRRALAALDPARSDTPVALVPPRTHTERVLERIWCRVLGREQVGVQENFFDLGGHSLLATQVVSQIRHELNVELPLDTIFAKPTIDSLAVYLLEQEAIASDSRDIGELLAEVESLSDEGAEGEFRSLEREGGMRADGGRSNK